MMSDIVPQRLDEDLAPAVAPPRKRRRRTAGGGATDDCFACRKRAVKCDRKRPYCTQCIEIGKECSGYKTTLTWGVGVASRGKLRGLSFPIAAANKDALAANEAGGTAGPVGFKARPRKPSVSASTGKEQATRPDASATPADPSSEFGASQPFRSPSLPSSIQQHQNNWQVTGYENAPQQRRSSGEEQHVSSLPPPPLQKLQTSPMSPLDPMSAYGSATTVGSYPESEYHSPLEYPRTPRSFVSSDSTTRHASYPHLDTSISAGSVHEYLLRQDSMASYNTLGSSFQSMASSSGMVFPLDDHVSAQPSNPSTYGHLGYPSNGSTIESFRDDLLGYSTLSSTLDQYPDEMELNDPKGMSLMDSRFASPFFHLSPRMQTLMDYYSRNICPFIVAFDGEENPYRRHILQLAMHNEGLQHAIAALSTNNQRMRTKGSIGFIEEIPSDGFDSLQLRREVNEPSPEESMYKQMSIDQLNMQLTDTRAAQDDSVLATLLILCLFHVCDSGFSKFKTQLAGVQKLLSLRNPIVQSDFTRWVEMFFIWFDVMTSTVNDREMQINRESLAMLDYSANLGALEQYSGIDGRLFKLIARLGRLNLLAQGRPVSGSGPGSAQPSQPIPMAHAKRDYSSNHSFRAADYDNLDGNGWGAPIVPSHDTHGGAAAAQFAHPRPAYDDRHEFWNEWHDLRERLRTWQMDVSSAAPHQLDAGQRDLIHINESFRHSALLYTERLGQPVMPSAHSKFQQPVAQALYHITALPTTSCVNKFLLWPLFITGTECVDRGHRNIIRLRCRNIMEESGFYNNLSTLDVLERVWNEADSHEAPAEVRARRRESTASQTGRYGQAFRWRKAMDRVDGEYIVI